VPFCSPPHRASVLALCSFSSGKCVQSYTTITSPLSYDDCFHFDFLTLTETVFRQNYHGNQERDWCARKGRRNKIQGYGSLKESGPWLKSQSNLKERLLHNDAVLMNLGKNFKKHKNCYVELLWDTF
jgi:hypothetical protein